MEILKAIPTRYRSVVEALIALGAVKALAEGTGSLLLALVVALAVLVALEVKRAPKPKRSKIPN